MCLFHTANSYLVLRLKSWPKRVNESFLVFFFFFGKWKAEKFRMPRFPFPNYGNVTRVSRSFFFFLFAFIFFFAPFYFYFYILFFTTNDLTYRSTIFCFVEKFRIFSSTLQLTLACTHPHITHHFAKCLHIFAFSSPISYFEVAVVFLFFLQTISYYAIIPPCFISWISALIFLSPTRLG